MPDKVRHHNGFNGSDTPDAEDGLNISRQVVPGTEPMIIFDDYVFDRMRI